MPSFLVPTTFLIVPFSTFSNCPIFPSIAFFLFFRYHGSLSFCSSGSPLPLNSPPPHLCLTLSLSLCLISPLPPPQLVPRYLRRWPLQPVNKTWQERRVRLSEASWTSSAWRASSREERAVCWWLTAGRFPSTMRHMCKVLSTSAAPSWWRGDCSKTRCPSLSCCNLTARWRWDKLILDCW